MSTAERVVVVALITFTVLIILWSAIRSYRRGGYGPPPRRSALTLKGRQRTNRAYARRGWAKPYDEHGRLQPAWERTPPQDSKPNEPEE